jgi:hypothetical protein
MPIPKAQWLLLLLGQFSKEEAPHGGKRGFSGFLWGNSDGEGHHHNMTYQFHMTVGWRFAQWRQLAAQNIKSLNIAGRRRGASFGAWDCPEACRYDCLIKDECPGILS